MRNEANMLNKILCLSEEGSEGFKSVVIINSFKINQTNLDNLELVIHQMKDQAESKILYWVNFVLF
jgi:hypothetical protein